MSELILGVSALAKRLGRSRNYTYALIRKPGFPKGTNTGRYAFDWDRVVEWCTSTDEDEAEVEGRRIADELMGVMR